MRDIHHADVSSHTDHTRRATPSQRPVPLRQDHGWFSMTLTRVRAIACAASLLCVAPLPALAAPPPPLATTPPPVAEHVVLFVLEGVDQNSLKTGPMPVLSKLAAEGSATWSASTVPSPNRLPAMASLLTGLPLEKHGIIWDSFEFSRGYPRAPTVFDYLDLSGGRDSAIFFMDESLYQLAKPEPYTDYQLCGALRPECNPERLVTYINQYFQKASSGHGYGHAIPALPHLLVVHLPDGLRAAESHGATSEDYRRALRSVDTAIGSVLAIFKQHHLLANTTIFVTSLHGQPTSPNSPQAPVPWIASGKGIKVAHRIQQPVSIIDTGATILRTMGLTTHTEWESRTIEDVFQHSPLIHNQPGKDR